MYRVCIDTCKCNVLTFTLGTIYSMFELKLMVLAAIDGIPIVVESDSLYFFMDYRGWPVKTVHFPR